MSSPERNGGELRLHVDDAVLSILALAVGRHHPEKVDRPARCGDVRVIALRHQHDVAFADDRRELGFLRVGVNQLQAERRRRHVDVEIGLFEHRGMFVRRPRRPVARRAEGDAGHDASGLDVLADQDVQFALRRRPADAQVQARILLHVWNGTNCTGYARSTGAATSARSQPSGPGVISIDASRGTYSES